MEINPDLRVSTMTLISKISSNVNLLKLYEHLPVTDKITFIDYTTMPGKGVSYKKTKKSRNNLVKRSFYNQVTLHIFLDKFVNVKIFNNIDWFSSSNGFSDLYYVPLSSDVNSTFFIKYNNKELCYSNNIDFKTSPKDHVFF